MRYVQQEDLKKKPEKKKKPRDMKKPGQYSSEDLMGAKRIPTKDGYK